MLKIPSLFATAYAVVVQVQVHAHTVITYPGWRGNNLITNTTFPYGMQWSYPCGGQPLSTNRTNWPVTGGAVAIQPGWFTGHATAQFYVNLGIGTTGPDGGPPNMSFPMVGPFQIVGPSNDPYPGTFCLPQVPLPANLTINVGDHATIQVVETAIHGGVFYNCVDITFSESSDVAAVNASNCFNSSTISFKEVEFVEPNSTDAFASSNSNSPTTSCPVCPTTSSACPTQTACPKANGNGNLGSSDVVGVGLPVGVLALGLLGL